MDTVVEPLEDARVVRRRLVTGDFGRGGSVWVGVFGDAKVLNEQRLDPAVWRSSVPMRVWAAILSVIPIALVCVARWPPSSMAPSASFVLFLVAAALFHFYFMAAFASRLVIRPWGVTVVNPLVTSRVRWLEVEGFESSGLSFLTIRCGDGRKIRVWAVQATNLMLMLGRPTRVDRVAEQIGRWCAVHPIETADVGPRRRLSRLPWYLWVTHAAVLALAASWYFGAFLPGR